MNYIIALVFCFIIYYIIRKNSWDRSVKDENLSRDEILHFAQEISEKYKEIKRGRKTGQLILYIKKSFSSILRDYTIFDNLSRSKKQIVPPAEWLLDNLYMIEKEYRGILSMVSRSYFKKLPVLYNNKPRIYQLAEDYVSRRDSDFDIETFVEFINKFQQKTPLNIAELWTLPVMIKIALIDKISRISDKITYIQIERLKGEEEAEKILKRLSEDQYEIEIDKLPEKKFSKYYIISFEKVLRDYGTERTENYYELLKKLSINEEDLNKIIMEENKEEAVLKVNMGGLINSLRIAEGLDVKDIFNSLSIIDEILNNDPISLYEELDFESKEHYRSSIEYISWKYSIPEIDIAQKVIKLSSNEEAEYKRHVGYYLDEDGKDQLLSSFNVKRMKIAADKKVSIYIFLNVAGTLILSFAVIYILAVKNRYFNLNKFIFAYILSILPFSEIVNSIINWSINNTVKPYFIPKIEIKDDIPEQYRTIVVIPAIIKDKKRGKELLDSLEIYYLANECRNLYFALLIDFKDSKNKEDSSDSEITEACLEHIKHLNKKYKKDEVTFYYLSRFRQYNQKEDKWIGWERKRGKLVEFNHLIRGDKNTSYNIISSDISKLCKAKYIITLDADTFLPKGAVKKLVGAMINPLNKPVIDQESKKVLRGYSLMQPRISVSTRSANRTPYSKIFSGETGFDIYTLAISDVYMDTFNEGIFTGKGIYDIDAFNTMTDGQIKENTVLSHDLLEGSLVRTALATDINFVDGYPATYNSGAKRLHRWVRGDWQLIKYLNNPRLNKLSKWKIIDNLRRSLLYPSIIILLLVSIIFFEHKELFLGIAFVSFLFPIIFDVSETVVTPIKGIGLSGDVSKFKYAAEQFFLIFSFIPFQGYLMIDAIIRTLYRVFISKRRLLEWQTAEDMEKAMGREIKDFISLMWPGTIYSIIILFISYYESARVGFIMLLPCLLWIISPYTAYFVSMENKEIDILLKKVQINDLRKLTRESFAYFQDFVNEKTRYIAPDNFQEEPNKNIALRTSPTNIGMTIISNIVAYDMGYIGILSLIHRLDKTINTMKKFTLYAGHFYNWYDLNDLIPLNPSYISTVDSGNLAGYLMITSKTLSGIREGSTFNENIIIGINDTIELANDETQIEIFPKYYEEKDINKFYDFLIKINSIIDEKGVESFWSEKLKYDVKKHIEEINYIKIKGNKIKEDEELVKCIDNIVCYFDKLVEEMDFTILYNQNKELLSIGYNLDKKLMDNCCYDLLASEARQASFIAIAKGEIDVKHWFRLGRAAAVMGKGKKGLVSWSGTMFEYFMPLLIMKNYKDSLLDLTYNSVISGQKNYCSRKKVPWGISESAFYDFDINMIYQYKAFGIPGIGLKRGLSNELVISPYSSILALMVDKRGAYNNLKKLKEIGAKGRYGFYEAIDYTHNIGRKNENGKVVKCFMVHHLGMSLLSLDNVINGNIMQNRFHSIPRVKSAELLLQEKAPKEIIYRRKFSFKKEYSSGYKNSSVVRNYGNAKTKDVETLLLSNGSCHMMITNSGSGWSKNNDITFYRWRRDGVKNDSGYFFYLRNIEENEFFSSFYEPTKKEGDKYNVSFSLSSAEFSRKDKNIKTTTKITLSAEDDVELRKITISNLGEEDVVIEITSYMEITLSSYSSDLSHPAFSNLFINTEYDGDTESLIGRRRKRDPESKEKFLLQSVVVAAEEFGDITYETSREKFIGRGRSLKSPQALDKDKNLSNTLGAVIDPIFSIRKRVKIKKNKSASIAFITAYSKSLNKGLSLIKKYKDMGMVDRTFMLSKIENEIELKYNSIKTSQANLYQLMASKIIFLSSKTESLEGYIKKIKAGQTDFWKYGISGDLPIVTLILRDHKGIYLMKQVLKGFNYLNTKGLEFDFVIEVKDKNSYEYPIWKEAEDEANRTRCQVNIKGKVFVLKEDTIPDEFRNLLYGSSRLLLDSDNGSLMNGIRSQNIKLSKIDMETKKAKCSNAYEFQKGELTFFNGYGGFNKNKGTYTIILNNFNNTPKPWVNIISNKNFGTMISEQGVSYSFNKNSRENKLSSWSNDPVIDGEGELIYFKDEEGALSSISGKPIRDEREYIIEHGFGYSVFKHYFMDLIGEMTVFVPTEENIKINLIKIKNNRDEDRRISIACYIDLVMGVNKEDTSKYITTCINSEQDYIYANNPYNYPFNEEIAYLKIFAGENSYTGKREEFIGRNQTLYNPEGLRNISLTNKVGAGFDPCLSALSSFDLKKGAEKWIIIILGEEDSLDKIDKDITKYKDIDTVLKELEKTKKYWSSITGSIKADTEDEDFNLLINGPLLYQTLSCRIWARTGFYQCGGAYGFRDQLQDVMALHYIRPDIERDHILLSASRQYEEGDVQHWWHPYVDSGIRTRFSDDLLWLPYVVLDYINVTGDYSILKEQVNYLKDIPLKEGEDERYNISSVSDIKEPILSHMIKAIDRSLKYGPHNLPLMGSGDWNDGMNTIGNKGKGESVWLGFFLCRILKDIIPVLRNENIIQKADYYLQNLNFIKENIENNAYDGSWYRRAYFDDGTPVGSISSGECKIDSLSQSWAVISGAAEEVRAKTSMDSLEKNLYLRDKGLMLLLTPPFNKWEKEPGYIKGYVPGVRENGGQYTHGAIWAVLAEILMKRGNMAYDMYSALNPINHSKTKFESDIYMVEPYIMTADIYASEPHIGRGGWSYYTGAAGWMYRVGIEGILGFKIEGKIMKVEPCIPDIWKGYKLDYITDKYDYKISVIRDENKGIYLDGIKVNEILLEEGKPHRVIIKI